MPDDPRHRPEDDDATGADPDEARQIEREIRGARRADLASLLASRDAGSHLRGASPTPLLARALLEVRQWLAAHLHDPEGVMAPVLLEQLTASADLLEANLGRPQATLAAWLPRILERPALVADLVREMDRQWGARYQERPHFEQAGRPPHPDDPYTVAGVSAELSRVQRLAAAAAG